MKKTLIMAFMALCTLTCNAQLKVDSLGRTTIGVANTNYGSSDILKVTGQGTKGIESVLSSSQSSAIAISANATSTGSQAIGVSASAAGATLNIGLNGSVMQMIPMNGHPLDGGAAVVGTTGLPPTNLHNYYAGYFIGDVVVTGTVNGTLLSGASSTSSIGGNTSLWDAENSRVSVTDRLQQVSLLQMERANQDGSLAANKAVEDKANPVQTKLSSVSYGLAADQLQEVYPELVYEDGEGNYSINYVEMVPLLVQSIKELSAKVATLEAQLGIQNPTKPVLMAPKDNMEEDATNLFLTIPDGVQTATLTIYDLSGKQVRTATVDGTTIDGTAYTRGLPTGTYICTLLVDGRTLGTRKIVVKN